MAKKGRKVINTVRFTLVQLNMGKSLVIVESPNKVKKIQSYLGPNYIVKASIGHIRDLPHDEMGVAAPDHKPIYKLSQGKYKVVQELKRCAKMVDRVYLATDPDREGEAIAWHLTQVIGKHCYERIVFNEITQSAVTQALSKAGQIDYALVQGQTARRVLDRYVGYSVSPLITAREGQKFTAGRVQSPAVLLVVERKQERENFEPQDYLTVKIKVNHPSRPFIAKLDTSSLVQEGELFNDEAMAQDAINLLNVSVVSIKTESKSKKPPAPFTTSTMTQAASSRLKMKPKMTMQLAQILFENGVITYHRTDSPTLASEAIEQIRKFALERGYSLPDSPHVFKGKADAQEGHEAIRPTNILIENPSIEAKNDALVAKALHLYQLIRTRAIASQLAVAVEEETVATLSAAAKSGNQYTYKAKGVVTKQRGWKVLTLKDDTYEDKAKTPDNPELPIFHQGDTFSNLVGKYQSSKTQPPNLYTQAALVKALEAKGIGRPSTFASIMDKIEQFGYVQEVDKRYIDATQHGCQLVAILKPVFSFMQLNYTRDIEKQIDLISKGKQKYVDMVDDCYQQLKNELTKLGECKRVTEVHTCEKCQLPMRRINGKKGAFWGCSGFKHGCKNTWQDEAGVPVTPEHPSYGKQESYTQKKSAKTNKQGGFKSSNVQQCPKCDSPMRERKGSKGVFLGCSNYPKCKHTQNIT